MNKNLKRFLTSKVSKRIVSGLTALVLVFGTLPLNIIYDELSNLDFTSISVGADEEHTDEDDPVFVHEGATNTVKIAPNQLVAYSKNAVRYHKYHQYDDLVITAKSGTSSKVFIEGFKGLGTEGKPFSGSISIDSNNSIVLNLDAPLFNYVKDSVTLSNNGNAFEISREYTQNEIDSKEENHIDKTPLLATYVVHDDENPSATWTVGITQPSAGDNPYLGDFGGFIGTMQEGSELIIDVTMDKTAEDTTARNVYGYNRDLGLLCGTMESDSKLTAKLTSNRGVSDIVVDNKSASGHVGGLVGQMRPGSVLDYTGSNVQASSEDIKTSATESYAGGVVGYNDGGTVKMTLPSGTTSYPVTQHIEGTGGAGGVYGYYAPGAIDGDDADINELNSKFDTSKFSINCQVNGEGFDGGVFGVLDCTHNYSFTGTNTITSAHNSGSVDGYGGLIGRYNNEDLSNSLTIGGVTAVSSKTTASYYGGAIAAVSSSDELDGGSCYVKFDGFTASASGADAMTFGGLAAKADNAFIDANNVTIGVSGEHKFQGGAIVGSLESGVLRLTGYTDITNAVANAASYEAGQIVGYRNNALIFAYSGSGSDIWKLKRPNTSIQVDDIGSWGEVVRFNAKDTSNDGETQYGFGSDTEVVTVYENEHYASVSGLPETQYDDETSDSYIPVSSSSDFAKVALNMQLYDSQSDGVLQFASGEDPSSSNIKLGADLVLSGLGISSFTRDNAKTDSTEAEKCVYYGTFDGAGHKVTLAIGEPYGYHGNTAISDHSVEGSGKIYRHRYNGLFGITDSSNEYTAQNVTFKGNIDVNAKTVMYVGALAGQATGTFKIDSVNMVDTVSENAHETTFTVDGDTEAYVGGLLGKAASGIETLEVNNCNVKCNINSSNSKDGSCFGGIIGWISKTSQSSDWNFDTITISGTISRSGNHEINKLGGLVAHISEYTSGKNDREIALTNIHVNGLSISVAGAGSTESGKNSSVGGVLGYSWLNVNPTFHNVQVSGSSVTLTETASSKGDLAGLVYQGTGHWIIETSSADVEVPDIDEETGEQKKDEETGEPLTTTVTEYYDGIKINSIAVSSTNAKSFGMIINKGMADNSAIFLDVRADDTTNSKKSYLISSATLTGLGSCIFDELVAYSATDGKVLENGQGIVSIHTGLTTDGTTSSKTYQAQTSRGAVPNNKTRYYYDLDTIREASGDKDLLMRWALNLYAHKSLSDYFTTSWVTDTTNNVSTIPYGIYDMENYSWYPINISGTVTVNGEFKFYNDEFEKSEAAKGGTYPYTRTSLYDSTADKATQHHLMHCGLFYNVSGGVTVGSSDITLQGNVGRFGKKTESSDSKVSGALICGTIKGSSTSSIATLSTSGNIFLDGIYVHDHNSNSYAPLLINKIGEFSTVVVKNVKAKTSSSYEANTKAASSLIGDVGSSAATNINLTFADIQIDARDYDHRGLYGLDGIYNTTSSLFYRASLLNTFRYSSGSATYDFKIDDDWKTSGDSYTRTDAKGVTYGSEIDDSNSQHLGKEYWYKDTNGGIYTNYNTPGASGTGAPSPAISFAGFLPYVYDKCTASDIDTATDKKYQIKVNWAETKMTGCGTYNDPYIITKSEDLQNISNILNGTHSTSVTVTLPNLNSGNTTWNGTQLKQKKWDNYGDAVYTYNGSSNYYCRGTSGYTTKEVQNYLAGAYYKIEKNAQITLPSDYKGLGQTDTEEAIFRGVIVGNGETITLTGDSPLIYQSNGCVVKGLNIVVSNSEITIDQSSPTAFKYGTSSGKAYGAVIGKILGGDNIIDDVTVSFGNSKIKLKNNAAQSIPVGGYVGVVVKGSLIFRGMEGYRKSESLWNSISGLGATTVKDNSGNTDLLYTDAVNKTPNMKWLYVNPIVGRVINAAVFTEGDAYRPFENGTREGVSAVDTQYEKYSQPVTMQNGTKNYSIADITDKLDMFVLNDIPERTSDWTSTQNDQKDFRHYLKIDISIPNAQSLYVMSLVTQAGLGGSNYLERSNRKTNHNDSNYYPSTYNKPIGGFLNTGSWGIAPYYSYRSTHVGQYTYVGNCGGSSVPEPTGSEAWYSDYSNAKTDNAQFNRSGGTTEHSWQHGLETIPYLIGKYTPKINSDTTGHTANAYDSDYYTNINGKELGYIAFCLTHQYSYLNLKFSADNSIYFMPDGFRGLGCLGYNNFIGGGGTGWTETYQDMIVHLFGIEGNGNTVNLNMSLYNYYKINNSFDAYAVDNVCPGFGFIDAMMQNKTCAVGTAVNGRYDNIDVTDNDYKISNLTLTGSVKSVVIDASSGNNYPMNNDLNNNYFVAVGGLVGNVVYRANNSDIFKVAISDINLSNLKVNGVRNTGGLMGYNQSADNTDSKTTIKNIETSNLEVSSGIYTGGLIGYSTQAALDISNVTIAEPNIKSNLNFAGDKYETNATGGIIGYAATGTENGSVYLHDITIGTESPQSGYSAYIGYNQSQSYPSNKDFETVRVGGLIGQVATDSSTMYNAGTIDYNTQITNCQIINVDLYGHRVGGVIGSCESDNSAIGVSDTIVKNTQDHTIYGHKLDNDNRGAGGIIGYLPNSKKFVVNNCLVKGYNITNLRRAGGIVGYNAQPITINNTEVNALALTSNTAVGGLVGYLNNSLNGYNIRTDDLKFTPFSSDVSYITGNTTKGNVRGHIVGTNNSKTIKIAGFSRNNLSSSYDCGANRMVGNYKDDTDTNVARYGSGGYVIFADYEGKSQSSDKSIVASDVNSTANVAVNTYSIESASAQDNNFPYVTTSPKRNIANDQFLTGDAIGKLTYQGSVFREIVDDSYYSESPVLGAYKNIPAKNKLSDQLSLIQSKFSTSSSEFTLVESSNMNFPLLVVDDNDSKTVTDMINNYIGVLTNTKSYNFALDVSGVYKVSLFRCTYNVRTSKFDVDTSAPNTACLKKFDYGNEKRFRMTPSDVDNGNLTSAQFSLIDVQFFDPSDTEKVAYHLYVPVYVKKLLEFKFDSALLSNTEYYPSAYEGLSGNTVFENLGTPVTMRFEYDYKRDATEWGNAINNGEDVYHNINKVIDVTKHHTQTNVWPSGTKMVLVDANNKDKYYYLNTAPTGSQIDLHSFQNSGVSFTPVPLQDLMTMTIAQSNSGTLTTTTEENATVKYGNNYYRPMTDEEKAETDTTSPNYVAPSNRYTASVSKVNPESYYLTIFTPKNEADTTIYHYELSTVSKLPKVDENDKGWRPNQVDKDYNATVGLYTGNLYSISIAMNVASKEGRLDIDSNNNYLDVTMTSTITLNGSTEVKRGVASNMLSNADSSSIHQVFLATYDMKPATGSSIVGVQLKAKPNVSVSSYQMYGGSSAQGTGKDIRDGYEITENYIELKNNEDLIDDISLETNGFAVTMATAFRLSYPLADDLSIQFPLNENPETSTGNIGTRVIGYSNISSSAESAPYSSTSKKDDSQTRRYYVTAQTKATLEYNVVESSGNIAGPFSDLGINAQEMDVDDQGNEKIKTKSLIHTQAKYDTSKLKERGDYIEMTLKISKKSDYDTALKLSDYVENIKITGLNGTPLFNQATDPDGTVKYDSENKVVIKVTREDNAYKIRVRKDQIQTIGNASDGVYYVPIEFEAFTGDAKFNSQSRSYSNYRMTLEMKMYQTDDAVENQYLIPTKATDYVVYTNAKVFPDVVH